MHRAGQEHDARQQPECYGLRWSEHGAVSLRRSTLSPAGRACREVDGFIPGAARQNFAMASSWRRVWVGLFTKFEVPWLATHGWLMKFVKYARALRVSGFSS